MIAGTTYSTPQFARWLEGVRDLSADAEPAGRSADFESLVATWLRWGLMPGELVVLAIPNGTPLVRHWLAVLAAGAVPVCVASSLPALRLRDLLSQLSARVFVAPRLDSHSFDTLGVDRLGGVEVARLSMSLPTQSFPGEAVLLTSGTSGFSSGCVFPVSSLLENARRHAEAISLQPEDVVLITLPLYFSYALVAQLLAALVVGCRVVITGPPFHGPTYLRQLEENKITVSALTPLVMRTLLAQQARFPDSLRKLTVGGDQLAAAHVEALLQARPGKELFVTYGLTEAGPRVATLAAHQAPPEQWASVGWPLRETQVHLEPVPDHTGECQLLVETSTAMIRRIGLVEARGESLRKPGLVATGDVFVQDVTGCLFFQRRLTDFLMRQGEKLCLASVRRLVASIPGVLHVRTQLVEEDGQPHFDLYVNLAREETSPPTSERARLEKQLRALLRRNELPRELHLSSMSDALASAHK